jgi:hypothetical protein
VSESPQVTIFTEGENGTQRNRRGRKSCLAVVTELLVLPIRIRIELGFVLRLYWSPPVAEVSDTSALLASTKGQRLLKLGSASLMGSDDNAERVLGHNTGSNPQREWHPSGHPVYPRVSSGLMAP